MNRPGTAFIMLGVALNVGCSDDSTGPVGLDDCPTAVSVSVGGGTTPTFSWEPACKLFFLNVEPVGSGQDLWLIITRGKNGIEPPVAYGAVPDGATLIASPTILQPGITYNVILGRFTGPGDEDGEIIAVREFTP